MFTVQDTLESRGILMRQSLDYLITEYQRNCFLAALSVLKNVDDANDAAQDAFMEYYLVL